MAYLLRSGYHHSFYRFSILIKKIKTKLKMRTKLLKNICSLCKTTDTNNYSIIFQIKLARN